MDNIGDMKMNRISFLESLSQYKDSFTMTRNSSVLSNNFSFNGKGKNLSTYFLIFFTLEDKRDFLIRNVDDRPHSKITDKRKGA
jgi:hypothetical protein